MGEGVPTAAIRTHAWPRTPLWKNLRRVAHVTVRNAVCCSRLWLSSARIFLINVLSRSRLLKMPPATEFRLRSRLDAFCPSRSNRASNQSRSNAQLRIRRPSPVPIPNPWPQHTRTETVSCFRYYIRSSSLGPRWVQPIRALSISTAEDHRKSEEIRQSTAQPHHP